MHSRRLGSKAHGLDVGEREYIQLVNGENPWKTATWKTEKGKGRYN